MRRDGWLSRILRAWGVGLGVWLLRALRVYPKTLNLGFGVRLGFGVQGRFSMLGPPPP